MNEWFLKQLVCWVIILVHISFPCPFPEIIRIWSTHKSTGKNPYIKKYLFLSLAQCTDLLVICLTNVLNLYCISDTVQVTVNHRWIRLGLSSLSWHFSRETNWLNRPFLHSVESIMLEAWFSRMRAHTKGN